jgi:hypothetical protein
VKTLRKTGLVLATLLAALGAFVAPSAASAVPTGTCAGTVIDSAPMKSGITNRTFGTLRLYYDSSSGKNCARATNGLGETHLMSVFIFRCKSGTGSTYKTCKPLDAVVLDEGHYSSYAGPVYTRGSAAGLCVYAGADMLDGDDYARADIGGHCG